MIKKNKDGKFGSGPNLNSLENPQETIDYDKDLADSKYANVTVETAPEGTGCGEFMTPEQIETYNGEHPKEPQMVNGEHDFYASQCFDINVSCSE